MAAYMDLFIDLVVNVAIGQEHFQLQLSSKPNMHQPSEQTDMYANSLQCTVQFTLLLPDANLFSLSQAVLWLLSLVYSASCNINNT